MLVRGRDVHDFRRCSTAGAMDGLVWSASKDALAAPFRDSHLGESGRSAPALPSGVIYMPKPWQPSEVLALAERAKRPTDEKPIRTLRSPAGRRLARAPAIPVSRC